MLLGIAAKNAILLVDYVIIARREHHLDRTTAILDACRKRARPIIMTTLAIGGGMPPVALGLGGDPSFRAPMAIVVIGGLITSTVLSLLVVPVVYGWMMGWGAGREVEGSAAGMKLGRLIPRILWP
ncbi:AcrB/AcrD/AcrF family protein [Azoarcus indigens]|uniref:AcrB/AcrD/AcrF family protein n=1 Tax=Azoarcus indigens TaxID=29545 RepID=A0A4R6EH95_9RHOO|nr:AcrB/AcrD/AcrF family protein [Azoarcus indigens]